MIDGYYLNKTTYLGVSKETAARALTEHQPKIGDVVDYWFHNPPYDSDWCSETMRWFPHDAVWFWKLYNPNAR